MCRRSRTARHARNVTKPPWSCVRGDRSMGQYRPLQHHEQPAATEQAALIDGGAAAGARCAELTHYIPRSDTLLFGVGKLQLRSPSACWAATVAPSTPRVLAESGRGTASVLHCSLGLQSAMRSGLVYRLPLCECSRNLAGIVRIREASCRPSTWAVRACHRALLLLLACVVVCTYDR